MLTCVGGLARRCRPGFLSRVMPAIRELPSRRQDGVLEAAVLTVWTFLLYAAGACPTIYVGDSGELVTAVHTVGIPHPSGYPLYVLTGKLFTLVVPLGSVAYRMSLFSAVFAAGAVGLVYAAARRAGLHPVASVFGASLLAVSPSYWGEANVQRVYSLNAFFVAASILIFFEWYRSGARGTLETHDGYSRLLHHRPRCDEPYFHGFAGRRHVRGRPRLRAAPRYEAGLARWNRRLVRGGPPPLRVSSTARPHRPAGRLGKLRNARWLSGRRAPARLLGPGFCGRATRCPPRCGRLCVELRTGALVLRRGAGSLGGARESRSRLAPSPPAYGDGREPSRPRSSRIALRSLHLAPLLHSVLHHGGTSSRARL